MKESFYDRLFERIDQLDPSVIQSYFLRLTREKGVLDSIFSTIKEGILVLNKDLNIEYLNQAAHNLLGLPEDALGEAVQRYIREVNWTRLFANADKMDASRQELEIFYPRHRFLTFYIVPQKEEEGQLEQATIIFHDVTDMHLKAESVKESEKIQALTMLAAGVAHEIGNPLNSLNIHLQLLKREARKLNNSSTEDFEELIDVCSQEVERLDAITKQFLGAVRSEKPTLKPLLIADILRESLQFMKVEIESRDIRVEAQWSESLPAIKGDATQLKQAFYNIIKNAIQAMPHGGQLKIACDADDCYLMVSFSDTGTGIPRANLNKILDAYHTDRIGGTGLGLFIVERVVREHGGRIGISSNEGEGTIFSIWLPLKERRTLLIEETPTIDSE
jgi:two-component system, sporulation sensor kinase E